jgi:hypothetical protein
MKLSTNTVSVLKNFSIINEGIFVKKGNVIETISKQKNILARAELSENFDNDFGIYDLNKFLGVLSLQKDTPEIEFDDKHIIIKTFGGRSKTNYRKASKDVILVPPDKKINMGETEINFTLTAEEITWVTKMASALSSPNIAFVSDGSKVKIQTFDAKDDSADVNTTELNVNPDGKKYRMIFATENLRFIEGSYDVKIAAKGIAHFKNTNVPIEYWVMSETGSKYEG